MIVSNSRAEPFGNRSSSVGSPAPCSSRQSKSAACLLLMLLLSFAGYILRSVRRRDPRCSMLSWGFGNRVCQSLKCRRQDSEWCSFYL